MSEIENIVEGFNAGYIIQQKHPEIFKIMEASTKDVELPFFDAFLKGGEAYTKDKLKSLLQDKIPNTESSSPSKSKDDIDIDLGE